MSNELEGRKRSLALYLVCLGVLMIVLDGTIVTAPSSIGSDLNLSGSSLTWMQNANMLTFGRALQLGGRLGDLCGPRRLFLAGIPVFTLASMACGLAHTQAMLLIARAVQGLGAAAVTRISIVNLPIGVLVYGFCRVLLPDDGPLRDSGIQRDISGAVAVTAAVTTAVYTLVNGNEAGWTSTQTLGLFGVAVFSCCCFSARGFAYTLTLYLQRVLANSSRLWLRFLAQHSCCARARLRAQRTRGLALICQLANTERLK